MKHLSNKLSQENVLEIIQKNYQFPRITIYFYKHQFYSITYLFFLFSFIPPSAVYGLCVFHVLRPHGVAFQPTENLFRCQRQINWKKGKKSAEKNEKRQHNRKFCNLFPHN